MRAPSDEVPDGTVLQEFRKGFMIGKTLLRPAMVQVRRWDRPLYHKFETFYPYLQSFRF